MKLYWCQTSLNQTIYVIDGLKVARLLCRIFISSHIFSSYKGRTFSKKTCKTSGAPPDCLVDLLHILKCVYNHNSPAAVSRRWLWLRGSWHLGQLNKLCLCSTTFFTSFVLLKSLGSQAHILCVLLHSSDTVNPLNLCIFTSFVAKKQSLRITSCNASLIDYTPIQPQHLNW